MMVPIRPHTGLSYYLAATFDEREKAREFVHTLNREWDYAYRCTARWVFAEDDEEGIRDGRLPPGARHFALNDIDDIRKADVFVLMTGARSSPGKMTETGYAMALGKPIYPVGARKADSVFCTLWHNPVPVDAFIKDPFGRSGPALKDRLLPGAFGARLVP